MATLMRASQSGFDQAHMATKHKSSDCAGCELDVFVEFISHSDSAHIWIACPTSLVRALCCFSKCYIPVACLQQTQPYIHKFSSTVSIQINHSHLFLCPSPTANFILTQGVSSEHAHKPTLQTPSDTGSLAEQNVRTLRAQTPMQTPVFQFRQVLQISQPHTDTVTKGGNSAQYRHRLPV